MHKFKLTSAVVGPREYDTESKAAEPISGAVVPWFQMVNDIGKGLAQLPTSRPDKGMVKLLGVVPKSMFSFEPGPFSSVYR